MNQLLIFLGAGIGGLLRFWISNAIYALSGKHFPFGTLLVNVSGCFLMGYAFVWFVEKMGTAGIPFRLFFLVGLLGGYTTFSTFSIETLYLLEDDHLLMALLNMTLSVLLCLIAVTCGAHLARN